MAMNEEIATRMKNLSSNNVGEFKVTTDMQMIQMDILWEIKNFIFLAASGGKLSFQFTATIWGQPPAKWELYLLFESENTCTGVGLRLTEPYETKVPMCVGFEMNFIPTSDSTTPKTVEVAAEHFSNGQFGNKIWMPNKLAIVFRNISGYLLNEALPIKLKFKMGIQKIVSSFENSRLIQAVHSESTQDLKEVMLGLLESEDGADVFFKTRDGQTITAHKVVLSAHSAVMKTMFEIKMKEAGDGIVELDDIGSPGLKIVLKFLYTGDLDDNWGEYCGDIVNAADKYQLVNLMKACDKILGTLCTKKNWLELLKIAELHGLSTAKESLRNFCLSDPPMLFRGTTSLI